jgi:hypothetical protein
MLDGALEISELKKLSELNGATFADLPQSTRLQFLLRPIKIITLNDKSDLEVRFDLFERLNTGGEPLTAQEIRACIYRGEFNRFLEKMAGSADFNAVVRLTGRQQTDGTREECVLRFFAFLNNYTKFEHSVVGFLNDYMDYASKKFEYESGEKIFAKTFRGLSQILPDGIVRGNRKITPINLFEAVSVGAGLAVKKSGKLVKGTCLTWMNSDELKELTTGATNNLKVLKGRIEFCRDRFLGVK